ncbi:ABC transporter permease [uncultured Agrococcus sp.]|uniref:ABC transporter permease n=1 Tax=uncultured Agrococcus sp. TaxID=382258 RepID=UPI0025DD9FAF|nr:ABC transporter permease [uncultured Agrococcus sp.]
MTPVRNWFRAWWLLMRWNAASSKMILPLSLVVQIMLAVGIVIGFGFLAPVDDPATALRLSTGAPTIQLLTTGLVLVPQAVVAMKQEGSYDWFRTLPAPRSAFLAADLTIWTLISLPGIILAVVVAAWRFDLDLQLSFWSPIAAIAVAAIAATIGYGMATALPPRVAQLLTQMLVFVILLFSPITFPSAALPDWFAAVHRVLPMEPMSDMIRTSLAPDAFSIAPAQIVVVLAWGAVAAIATLTMMSRRS